jgi:hypothetical protein
MRTADLYASNYDFPGKLFPIAAKVAEQEPETRILCEISSF